MFAGKYRGGSSLQTGGRDHSLQRPGAVSPPTEEEGSVPANAKMMGPGQTP